MVDWEHGLITGRIFVDDERRLKSFSSEHGSFWLMKTN
jgi:hypothetical protein